MPRSQPSNGAMLHIGRCGSSALGRAIDAHPQVRWDGEIFERRFRAAERQGPQRDVEWHRQRDYRPRQYIRRRRGFFGRRIFGFEMKFFHLRIFGWDVRDFVQVAHALGVHRFILLERRNLLRKIVSSVHLAERQRQRRLSDRRVRREDLARVTIDLDDVGIDREHRSLPNLIERYQKDLDDARKVLEPEKTLFLAYEDDIRDRGPDRTAARVFQHLGLPVDEAAFESDVVSTPRQPPALAKIVTNYAELAERLRGTRFEWMLES